MIDSIVTCLLPGDGPFPPADRTQVPAWVAARAEQSDGVAAALAWIRQTLPADFETLGATAQADALRACEQADPAAFGTVLTEAYSAYYSDGAVLAVIEAMSGFPARPPQPLGHELPPFDWPVLEARRRRE